ncbi:hypothetical protein ACGVWS_06515 [Enterobacteriaceae bacterium LUAb1]
MYNIIDKNGFFHDENIRKLLKEAVNFARNHFSLKSANKCYPNKDELRAYKLRQGKPDPTIQPKNDAAAAFPQHIHSCYTDRLRDNRLEEMRSQVDQISLAISATGAEAKNSYYAALTQYLQNSSNQNIPHSGNCSELAMLAFGYLTRCLRRYEINNVNVALANYDNFDHAFLMVTNQKMPVFFNISQLRTGMGYICDPWANISCKIEEYVNAWQNKMLKWHARGLKIAYYLQPNPGNNGYTPPRSADYYLFPIGDKLSPNIPMIMQAPIRGLVALLDQRFSGGFQTTRQYQALMHSFAESEHLLNQTQNSTATNVSDEDRTIRRRSWFSCCYK